MTDIKEAKAGPKPKANQQELDQLKLKVDALERVVAKMAHNAGVPNSLFIENDLQYYELQAKDLKKYA